MSAENPFEFEYMMLGRLKMDVEYYFDMGSRSPRNLYYDTFAEHIEEMIKLWEGFPDDGKPEWLTLIEIENYLKKDLENDDT